MSELSPLAIGVATVAAFVVSGGWYAALGSRLAELHPAYGEEQSVRPADIVLELLRSLVVAVGVAALLVATDIDTVGAALLLALGLWVCFPLVILAGSVLHERVPPALAAIHAGDWLVKLLAISVLVHVLS